MKKNTCLGLSIASVLIAALCVVSMSQAATVVPITNGTFGSGGTPPTGWTNVTGTVRTFNSSGNRLISTSPSAAYVTEQITATAVAADTTYLLEFDQGFAASGARSDDYDVFIGTSAATVFTSLGTKTGTVTSNASSSAGVGVDNSHYNSLQVTTGATVSGDSLAVRLGADKNTGAWLGYDNVFLSAFAANEIVIGNHSFDMTTRDNQGTLVGGLDNLEAWTEVSGTTSNDQARGFDGGGFRSLIGYQVTDTFTAEQVLDTAIAANTAYDLAVDIGFMQSGAGITGDYKIELGTSNGGVFTALATLDSTLTQSVPSEYNIAAGNALTVNVLLNTGASVSGDDLAIRLTKEDTTTFFGFDRVELTIPEPATMALLALGGLGVLRRRRR